MTLLEQWLNANLQERNDMAALYGIVKKRPTHIADNQIRDDGYDFDEVKQKLESATPFKVQKEVKSVVKPIEPIAKPKKKVTKK